MTPIIPTPNAADYPNGFKGWMLYDGQCPMCQAGTQYFGKSLHEIGYKPMSSALPKNSYVK